MTPFRFQFRPGIPIFEQVVYAATRAMMAGQLRTGDAFPSVRALSREFKINPNTAHKVVGHLIAEGLLETRPGIGTVVTAMLGATRRDQSIFLGKPVEELVVQAKRAGVAAEALHKAVDRHWTALNGEDTSTGERRGRR